MVVCVGGVFHHQRDPGAGTGGEAGWWCVCVWSSIINEDPGAGTGGEAGWWCVCGGSSIINKILVRGPGGRRGGGECVWGVFHHQRDPGAGTGGGGGMCVGGLPSSTRSWCGDRGGGGVVVCVCVVFIINEILVTGARGHCKGAGGEVFRV